MTEDKPSKRICGRAAAVYLGVVLVVGACGDPIAGLTESPDPLLSFNVKVVGDLSKFLPAGEDASSVRLRAALVWGAVPAPSEFCTRNALGLSGDASATAVYFQGCKDVFAFVPKLTQATADVRPDGTATIELMHLPTAEVLVGTPEGRVAHGSIVIFDDRNGNGTLNLSRANHEYVCREDGRGPNGNGPSNCPPEFGDVDASDTGDASGGDGQGADGGTSGQVNNRGGGEPGRNGQEFGQDEENNEPLDYIYGASFKSMLLPHVRITFREGSYTIGSFFYPTLGCAAPPGGFSAIAVSGLPTKSTCEAKKLADTVVEVALQATETISDFGCEPQSFHFHDSRRAPDLNQPWVCLDGNALIGANKPSTCKGLAAVSLRGCRQSHECAAPDWDDHEDPPDWWPCGKYVDPIEKKKAEAEAKKQAAKP